jgi:hypothetical protein
MPKPFSFYDSQDEEDEVNDFLLHEVPVELASEHLEELPRKERITNRTYEVRYTFHSPDEFNLLLNSDEGKEWKK